MKQSAFKPRFVETVPEDLESGTLYISIRFRTASHLCACGCETKVVTPIKPAKWELTYNGDTISLWPSIGRWQLPCKSHYIIRDNQVLWRRAFTDDEMERVLDEDTKELRAYYQARQEPKPVEPEKKKSFFDRLFHRNK